MPKVQSANHKTKRPIVITICVVPYYILFIGMLLHSISLSLIHKMLSELIEGGAYMEQFNKLSALKSWKRFMWVLTGGCAVEVFL